MANLTKLSLILIVVVLSAFQQAPAPVLSPQMQKLCKAWSFTGSEAWGVVAEPTAEQKSDRIEFKTDMSYSWTYNGKVESGTWTSDKSAVWVSLKTSDGVTKRLKVVKVDATSLEIDYKDQDDVHNMLRYKSSN
jgi:outer membrane lipoprotein-sorting protein